MTPWSRLAVLVLFIVAAALAGCSSTRPALPPLPGPVDLTRFMGAWYVVGYTPILVDKRAHNAVEHYALADDGRILTTYQFRKGSFTGNLKTYTPTGFVADPETRAAWKMQFVWPFKADYVILHVSEDYRETIIVHPGLRYAWIMHRTPDVDDATYEALVGRLEQVGFDRSRLHRVPHDWSGEAARRAALERAGSQHPLAPR